jgi:hypothetical protein
MGFDLKTRDSAILYHNKETEPTEYILSYATEEILGFSFRDRIVSFTWRFQKLETRAIRLLVNFVQTSELYRTIAMRHHWIPMSVQFTTFGLQLFAFNPFLISCYYSSRKSQMWNYFPSPSGKTVSCPRAIDYANIKSNPVTREDDGRSNLNIILNIPAIRICPEHRFLV